MTRFSLDRIEVSGLVVDLGDDEGSAGTERRVDARAVSVSALTLEVGGLSISAPAVDGTDVTIAWGGPRGFSMQAASLRAPELRVASNRLEVAVEEVVASDLDVHDGDVTLGRATCARGSVTVASNAEPSATNPSGDDAGGPLLDWRVLDALTGDLRVDADVDLTVPILGSRRATHRFRVPMKDGTIDFMALENDLSTLENTLLDFAVRDGGLVLERGIPLLPTRGHGKPIVVWTLSPDDLALAERDRVRLAVLPSGRLVRAQDDGDAPAEGTKPAVALRQLAFRDIDVRVALGEVVGDIGGRVRPRRIGRLELRGDVFHDVGGERRAGNVVGSVADLDVSLAGVAAGSSMLDVARVALAEASSVDLAFAGLHVERVALAFAQLAVDGVALRRRRASHG